MNGGDDILSQFKERLSWGGESIETLYTNPTGGWIGYEYEVFNNQGQKNSSISVELDMNVGGPLNIFIDKDPHDREGGNYLSIDIPNEHVFAVHEWLTKRLYGDD